MRIGIIGCGVVGSACADGFERIGHDVFRCDPKLNTTITKLLDFKPDIVFISVPTPSREDGSCDVSIVEKVLEDIRDKTLVVKSDTPIAFKHDFVVCIKSTVPPGTTERLSAKFSDVFLRRFHFVPEFLRERSAFSDFVNNHDLLVIGGKCDRTSEAVIKRAHGKLPKKVVTMSATEAELLKYYSNCFNAVRVTFANVFYELAQKVGANYNTVKDAFICRGTATDLYMDVNDKFRGYGGPCLPKEVKAIAHLIKEHGLDYTLFQSVDSDNAKFKITVPEGMRE